MAGLGAFAGLAQGFTGGMDMAMKIKSFKMEKEKEKRLIEREKLNDSLNIINTGLSLGKEIKNPGLRRKFLNDYLSNPTLKATPYGKVMSQFITELPGIDDDAQMKQVGDLMAGVQEAMKSNDTSAAITAYYKLNDFVQTNEIPGADNVVSMLGTMLGKRDTQILEDEEASRTIVAKDLLTRGANLEGTPTRDNSQLKTIRDTDPSAFMTAQKLYADETSTQNTATRLADERNLSNAKTTLDTISSMYGNVLPDTAATVSMTGAEYKQYIEENATKVDMLLRRTSKQDRIKLLESLKTLGVNPMMSAVTDSKANSTSELLTYLMDKYKMSDLEGRYIISNYILPNVETE